MESFIFSIFTVLFISFFSILGIFLIYSQKKLIKKINLLLVSLAVGALLGDSFIHLIPQSYEKLDSFTVSIFIIIGILIFFILEKILRWHHCHDLDCSNNHSKHVATLNILGDTVHNSLDGMIIAASFTVDIKLGLLTSLSVLLHEIPQEMGDFAILFHSGLSLKKILIYNLLSSLSSVIGVLLVFILGSRISLFSDLLLPITAGAFIYLAASDLIPELHRHDPPFFQSFFQLLFILLGVLLMSLLVFFE
jgi:zinc and cadmium transporter